jgi:hypothetical protein
MEGREVAIVIVIVIVMVIRITGPFDGGVF